MSETHQQAVETMRQHLRPNCISVHAVVGFLNGDYVDGYYFKGWGGVYGAEFIYLDWKDVFKALCGQRLKIV